MDFQSAMETFAEAWVAANTGKIALGNVSTTVPTLPDTRLESPLQQQLGNSKAVGADGGSLPSDYPKIPSGMDLSSAAGSTTSPPAKRLKGIPTRKLSPSHNNNNSPDFHSSAGSTAATTTATTPLISNSQNIPNTLGKSMPIHCIIEVSNSSIGSSGVGGSGSSRKDSISLESALSATSNNNLDIISQDCSSTGKVVEVDDFVIIPAGTPFQDVVTTVLTILGYPKDIIRQAEGTISLRNWKPLRLDQVCDSASKTVGDILNDLTNHATLRVLVTRAKGGSTEDLKEKLLRLLLAHSSTLLMGAGCPLDEMTMSQLVKGQWPQNLADDVKRRFDQWYQSLHPGATLGLLESLQHSHMQQQQHAGNSHHLQGNILPGSATSIHLPSHHHNHLVNGSGGHHHQQQSLHHHHDLQSSKSSPFIDDDHNHPVFQGLAAQKTRMRTSFDPEMELPKLQQWFAENPHPSRHQIQQYVRELNMLECRKDRKPLDVNNVIYWFKNARAAQKRNELRYHGLPNHQAYAHHPQQLGSSSHPHMLHQSHGLMDCRDRPGSQPAHPSLETSNGESCNDHSGASSCRDSDEADPEISKDNMEDHDSKEDRLLRNIKEERDDDYINVDGDGGGNGQSVRSPRETKVSTNNNEEPKDLSSKSPEENHSEDTSDGKTDFLDKEGNGLKRIEKSEVTLEENVDSNIGADMGENSNNSISSSASPRSSPGISPNHNYDFNGPPSMVNRYHPFFEHPSFMAYRNFNFGPNFPAMVSSEGSAYEAISALNAARKSLLPVGKPSAGLDMFPEFPQGLNPQMVSNGQRSNASGNLGVGVASSCDPLSRLRTDELFPSRPASSADIINSIINSNRGEFSPLNLGSHHHSSANSLGMDERRKRNRTFIDPVTEVVLLENWFKIQTHPSHNLILKYTDELNRMPYRQKFPKLEPKNVQFWFKNRRAKCKRLKMNM